MKTSSRYIFIALSLLAFGQMIWWAYLLMSQQNMIAELMPSPESLQKAHGYHVMIYAEGFFFFVVLSCGIGLAYRSLAKELQLRRSQSDFLGAITHELKTPLTNVRLCLDTLERTDLSEETKIRYVQRAQSAVDKLVEEVETILTVSNKSTLTRDIQKIDLNELVRSVISEVETSEEVNISFDSKDELFATGPFVESRLIFRNLLDNAIKYSPRSKIVIQTLREKNKIIAKISDSGIGLTTTEASRAFEPFYRGDAGRKLDPTGTGLGLSLVKRLADAFNIQIFLNSEGRDKGTTAHISWPVQKVPIQKISEKST